MNRDRQQETAADSIAALKDAEERVRATDLQMRALFLQRLEALRALARWKKERGLPAEDRELELRTLSELTPGVEEEAQRSFYLSFLQDVLTVGTRW
jgi:chorismate mutase